MFILTIYFIVLNVYVEFVLIYRPHPVCIFMPEETIRSASVVTIPTFGNELKVLSLEMQMAKIKIIFSEIYKFHATKIWRNIFTIKFNHFNVQFKAHKNQGVFNDFLTDSGKPY